ncbi:MAG TPA: hypothetical protein VN429_00550 [Methanospirillum sp.]|uniref:hypothetical protein n=1 Tax=Methanospirillum sp. TaxID=45200 RepID=UPI002BD9D8B5|nr:hypothetical protein [Methanospirillum sp.]HWQ62872.1 hypothetical protein [Methanospirillum sp.]
MKTISEIRKEGIQALTQALGPVDMARFISSYENGSGDYTRDRHQWLPNDPDEIIPKILERQKNRNDNL